MSRDHRMTRRELLRRSAVAGAAALGGASLLGASARRSAAGPPPGPAKSLTIGLGGDAPSLNPLTDTFAPLTSFYFALWDPAIDVAFDSGGRVRFEPVLAESWRVLDDRLTWEFKLRQGVKFHNGEDCDAEAFAFSLNTVINDKTQGNNVKLRLKPIWDGVRVVDKYTVQIKTSIPYVLTPNVFTEFHVVPPRYFQQVGPQRFAEAPVGSGPFRFVEWQRGQHLVLQRNPSYWRKPPQFDRLVFRPFPEDATRVAALEAGELDIAYNITPDATRRLTAAGIRIQWTPIGQGMNLTMKLTIPSPLTDVRVRQAMNYAVNKRLLIQAIMGGYGRELQAQLAGPSALGFNPALASYPYDPSRAKRLLADAGFANGFRLDFDTSQGRYAKQKEVSEYLVGQFKNVGIELNMQIFEWGSFIDKVYSSKAAPVFYTGSNWYPEMDSLYTFAFFESKFSRKQYNDPEFDRMLDAARAEFTLAKRVAMMQQLHAYLREKAVTVWLFESPDIFGVSKRVAGFTPTPDDRIHFASIQVSG
jgi:peptide/nickel transport system substrate-binding protein